jgi:hypothetical protein
MCTTRSCSGKKPTQKKTHDFSMFYLLQVAETHKEENVVKE